MSAASRITLRSVLLGAATAALLNLYTNYTGLVMGSSSTPFRSS